MSLIDSRIKLASQAIRYPITDENPSQNDLQIELPEFIKTKSYWPDGEYEVEFFYVGRSMREDPDADKKFRVERLANGLVVANAFGYEHDFSQPI